MVFRFGPFELDDARFELRRDGKPVPLASRPFDLLLVLVRRRARLVSKTEIMHEVWAGMAVTKDSLPQAMMAVRRALDDDVERPQFIETARGRGYRFVADVEEEEAFGAGSEVRPAGPVSTSLVGRHDAIVTLRDGVTQARAGRGRVVFIAGEAGLGKTRLVEELCAMTGEIPLVVSCRARDGAPEPWAFVQIFREAERRGAKLDAPLAAFARTGIDQATQDDPKARFRSLDHAASALTAFAGMSMHVVVLEDVHSADPVSVSLLDLFARRVREAPMLLVCTYRPASARAPSFEATAFALAREPFASVVRLAPFTQDETALFLERATGRPPSPALVARLFEKTRGNPSFLAELAHIVRAEEGLQREVATSALVGGDGMREAIAHLLASLPEGVRRVLTMAAVFGVSFPLAPLAAALGMTNALVLEALDAARAARVVARAEPDVFRFTYPLVRDVLHNGLGASERARHHAVVAEALIQHAGAGDTHERAGEIAAHLVESAIAGDVDAAVEWSLRAARLARDAGARPAARRYAEGGLRALRFARAPSPDHEESLRAFVLGERP